MTLDDEVSKEKANRFLQAELSVHDFNIVAVEALRSMLKGMQEQNKGLPENEKKMPARRYLFVYDRSTANKPMERDCNSSIFGEDMAILYPDKEKPSVKIDFLDLDGAIIYNYNFKIKDNPNFYFACFEQDPKNPRGYISINPKLKDGTLAKEIESEAREIQKRKKMSDTAVMKHSKMFEEMMVSEEPVPEIITQLIERDDMLKKYKIFVLTCKEDRGRRFTMLSPFCYARGLSKIELESNINSLDLSGLPIIRYAIRTEQGLVCMVLKGIKDIVRAKTGYD